MKRLLLILFVFSFSFSYSQNSFEATADSLTRAVEQFTKQSDAANAIKAQNKLAELYAAEYGKKSTEYIISTATLGWMYLNNKQYQKALNRINEILPAYIEKYGEEDKDLFTIYNWLGLAYLRLQKNKEAAEVLEKIITYFNEHINDSNSEYNLALINLGVVYRRLSLYDKAETLTLKKLKIDKAKYGEKHPIYADNLLNLSAIYIDTYRYDEAVTQLQNAIAIYEPAKKKHFEELRLCYGNMAAAYRNLTIYDSAVFYAEKTLNIILSKEGEDSYSALQSTQTLGLCYINLGGFAKAEDYLKQCEALVKKHEGTKNIRYARTQLNLGLLYKKTYSYTKALNYYERSLATLETIGKQKTPTYAQALANTAIVYGATGQRSKGKNYLLKAIEIRQKLYSKPNISLAKAHMGVAIAYEYLENQDSAILHYNKSIAIEEILSTTPTRRVLNMKALVSMMEKDYTKAAGFIEEELKLIEQKFSDDHPDYSSTLNLLAYLYANNKHPKTNYLVKRAIQARKKQLKNIFSYLPEDELSFYLSKKAYDNNELAATLLSETDEAELKTEALNNLLFLKSAILKNSNDIQLAVKNSNDKELQDTYAQYISLQKQLAKAYTTSKAEQKVTTKQLETKIQELEKVLAKKSAAFRSYNALFETDWKDVQNNLQTNEAAIEFVSFNKFGKKKSLGTWYGAFVIRKNLPEPVFIVLGEAKEIQRIIGNVSPKSLFKTRSNELLGDVTQNEEQYDTKLYSLVWQKLEPSLKDCNTIYYSPDGLLNRVAFQALPIDDKTLLIDKYQLVQLLSLRTIAENKTKPAPLTHVSIFGGIDYDNATQTYTKKTSITADLPAERNVTGSFTYLQGTAKEAAAIKNSLTQYTVTTHTGIKATEEVFKQYSGASPQILHLATHGFFLPAKKQSNSRASDNTFESAENPLMRSGLALAGANKAWAGKTIEGQEDGILTAYEVSLMDLSNTQLVVLSACQTGLGEVQATEGVYGLQRAFKIAGAKQLIMSLWSVPDKETKELMELFYAQLAQTNNTRQAFTNAQKTMRAKYPPYYWAAFVLVE